MSTGIKGANHIDEKLEFTSRFLFINFFFFPSNKKNIFKKKKIYMIMFFDIRFKAPKIELRLQGPNRLTRKIFQVAFLIPWVSFSRMLILIPFSNFEILFFFEAFSFPCSLSRLKTDGICLGKNSFF